MPFPLGTNKQKQMKHNKLTAILAAGLIVCGCTQKPMYKRITPLQAAYDIKSLNDATVPASFSSDGFNWMGGNLSMTVYNEDLYDAADIAQMQVGDTIIYEAKPMVVMEKKEEQGGITINGGVEEGGCYLLAGEGGTYIPKLMDDHSVYTSLEKTEIALSQDFVLIDCGEMPTDPMDTIRTDQKLYIEDLKDYRRDFNPMNTRVVIENGEVKSITRHWIP